MRQRRQFCGARGAAISKVSVDCGGKKALKASGSSSRTNAMDRFVTADQTNCPDHNLAYTSSGSGAGLNNFFGGQTDFAGSDSPLDAAKGEYDKAQARCGSPAWNLPTVYGPIAITFNVPGVDHLAVDGPTAAKIFNGRIKAFLTSATDNGQTGLDTSGYIPIPDSFKTKLGTAINAIS